MSDKAPAWNERVTAAVAQEGIAQQARINWRKVTITSDPLSGDIVVEYSTDPDSHYPTRIFCEVTVSGETTYTIQTCADDGWSIEQVSQSFYNRVLDSLVKQEADRVSRQIVPAPTTLGACWWETNTKAHNKCLLEVAKRERKAAEKAAKKK